MKSIIAVVNMFLFFIGCTTHGTSNKENSKPLRGNMSAIEVSLELATIKPFEYYIHASGKITPQHKVEVRAKTTGVIKQLHISNGQTIRRKSILLALESDQQRLAIEKANTQLNVSRIKYESDIIAFGTEEELNDAIWNSK